MVTSLSRGAWMNSFVIYFWDFKLWDILSWMKFSCLIFPYCLRVSRLQYFLIFFFFQSWFLRWQKLKKDLFINNWLGRFFTSWWWFLIRGNPWTPTLVKQSSKIRITIKHHILILKTRRRFAKSTATFWVLL